jgi:hypothetical protein
MIASAVHHPQIVAEGSHPHHVRCVESGRQQGQVRLLSLEEAEPKVFDRRKRLHAVDSGSKGVARVVADLVDDGFQFREKSTEVPQSMQFVEQRSHGCARVQKASGERYENFRAVRTGRPGERAAGAGGQVPAGATPLLNFSDELRRRKFGGPLAPRERSSRRFMGHLDRLVPDGSDPMAGGVERLEEGFDGSFWEDECRDLTVKVEGEVIGLSPRDDVERIPHPGQELVPRRRLSSTGKRLQCLGGFPPQALQNPSACLKVPEAPLSLLDMRFEQVGKLAKSLPPPADLLDDSRNPAPRLSAAFGTDP